MRGDGLRWLASVVAWRRRADRTLRRIASACSAQKGHSHLASRSRARAPCLQRLCDRLLNDPEGLRRAGHEAADDFSDGACDDEVGSLWPVILMRMAFCRRCVV